jgi:hypothetical protein
MQSKQLSVTQSVMHAFSWLQLASRNGARQALTPLCWIKSYSNGSRQLEQAGLAFASKVRNVLHDDVFAPPTHAVAAL